MYKITAINSGKETVIHEESTESSARLASGKLVEEVNQIPSFTFSLLPSSPCWESGLNDRRTIISVLNTLTDEVEFEGTLLYSTDDMSSSGSLVKSCICEGYLGYLCDSIQPYHHYESYTIEDFLTALLDVHNASTPEEKHIYLGMCDFSGDNTNSKTTAYRSTLEEIQVNLIDRIGGEIRIRKVDGRLVLDFLTVCGVKCSTTIELAKNIQTLSVSTDTTNIVTRLVPLGTQLNDETAERLTIAEVNDGKIYIDDDAALEKYGVIMGTAVFDDITLPENLIKAGREYLTNNNRVKKAYSAQVLDLSLIDSTQQSIRAGNTYHFVNSLIGLDEELRLMKRTVDIYKPYKPDVEIGDKAERITDIATRTAQLIEYEMPKQKLDILASAKATATDLIRAGISGYVVVNENEICIMDTPDKSTATRVWRWNSGGFGYSNTGYNGTYGTAMTMDGAIVADFITAGVLRGLEIINGDGTFHVDTSGNVTASSIDINNGSGVFRVLPNGTVRASALEMTGGKIDISTASDTQDVISLSYNGNVVAIRAGVIHLFNAIKNRVILSNGGIWGYSQFEDGEGEQAFALNAATGRIDVKEIDAEKVVYKRDDNWYSLEGTINYLNERIDNANTNISTLWNAVFGDGE